MAVIVLGIYFSAKNDPKHNAWISLLFLLPVVTQVVGWAFIHWEKDSFDYSVIAPNNEKDCEKGVERFCIFYNITMTISVLVYGSMWLFYIFESGYWIEGLSWLSGVSLFLIFIQFGIVVFVTYIVMENTHKIKIIWMKELKTGLELFPFWRFAHFFSIFMSVSFLFGFSFAFHDLSYRNSLIFESPIVEVKDSKKKRSPVKMAIYVDNLNPDDLSDENVDNGFTDIKQSQSATPSCFYFRSGRAEFTAEDRARELISNLTDKNNRLVFAREDRNYQEISKLVSLIEQNKSQGLVRITLIGRADDKQSGGIYSSNYDLSEARINMIRNKLTEQLYASNNRTWQSIDWITVPYSNEPPSNISRKCRDLDLDAESGRRVVEAYLYIISPDEDAVQTKEVRKRQADEFKNKYKKIPDLMDYIYFSIYTISTTGYGDIKPATTYSKFLVSLENFFEIFFLVCFMNSLISLKRELQSS